MMRQIDEELFDRISRKYGHPTMGEMRAQDQARERQDQREREQAGEFRSGIGWALVFALVWLCSWLLG